VPCQNIRGGGWVIPANDKVVQGWVVGKPVNAKPGIIS